MAWVSCQAVMIALAQGQVAAPFGIGWPQMSLLGAPTGVRMRWRRYSSRLAPTHAREDQPTRSVADVKVNEMLLRSLIGSDAVPMGQPMTRQRTSETATGRTSAQVTTLRKPTLTRARFRSASPLQLLAKRDHVRDIVGAPARHQRREHHGRNH